MRGTTTAEEAEEWPLFLTESSEPALLRASVTQQELSSFNISESDQFTDSEQQIANGRGLN